MKKEKGFTLLEVMVVIIICGIIASFAIPQLLNHSKGYSSNKYKSAPLVAGNVVRSEYVPESCFDGSCTGAHYELYIDGVSNDCAFSKATVKVSESEYYEAKNNNFFWGRQDVFERCQFQKQ